MKKIVLGLLILLGVTAYAQKDTLDYNAVQINERLAKTDLIDVKVDTAKVDSIFNAKSIEMFADIDLAGLADFDILQYREEFGTFVPVPYPTGADSSIFATDWELEQAVLAGGGTTESQVDTWIYGYLNDSAYVSAYTGDSADALLALAATALQDVPVTYPDANTIAFGENAVLQLDPATLEINGSDQLTVVGGVGFDSVFVYQRIANLEDDVDSLGNLISAILTALDTCGCGDIIVEDNTSPLKPTSYVAVGGTSQTQYVSTWTDPVEADLDSIRFYEGSANDSTSLVWITSIAGGLETFTRTGRTANTTYWSAIKAVDDSGNVSYFSNLDSATTIPTAGGSFQMETQRFIDDLITPLASGTETAIDSFVVMLKTTFSLDSLPQMFNAIYLHAIETEEASLKNLVKRTHDATESGSDLIWTQNEGWIGAYDGGATEGVGYLDLNYNPATDTNNVAGRLSMGITNYVRQCSLTDAVWDAQALYNLNDGDGNVLTLSVRRADDGVLFKMNDDTFNSTLINATGNVGIYTLSRTNATRTLFKNSASFLSETITPTEIPNLELWLLRNNSSGTPAGRSGTKQISITMVHRDLTLSEHQDLVTILEWWMDRWGKGVL